jgi:hypothetical protein
LRARWGDINFALTTLAYLADPDFNGADTLTVVTSDASLSDTDDGRDHRQPVTMRR